MSLTIRASRHLIAEPTLFGKIMNKLNDIILTICLFVAGLFSSPTFSSEKHKMEIYSFNEQFKVTQNLWFELEDGLKIQFQYHSHKKRAPSGPKSPLIIAMKYSLDGKVSEKHHYVHPDEEGVLRWKWDSYNIQISSYKYGTSMSLIVDKDQP